MVGLTIRKAGLAMNERQNDMCAALVRRVPGTFRRLMGSESGQGTTEYAILVGVIVVIAIVAVTAFRGKLQELWSAISDGINGL